MHLLITEIKHKTGNTLAWKISRAAIAAPVGQAVNTVQLWL